MLTIAILVVGMLALIVQRRFHGFRACHTTAAKGATAGVASETV